VVDDGSTDLTAEVSEKEGACVVRHKTNKGYDHALLSGFRKAEELRMETIISFDADGQHDPKILSQILNLLYKEDNDLVITVRPLGSRIAERIFGVYTASRFGVKDVLSGVKGYKLSKYRKYIGSLRYESVGTEWALYGLRNNFKTAVLPILVSERRGKPRFGGLVKANYKIAKSCAIALIDDFFCSDKTNY